jgi:dihydrofolate synthase / folylpolyglutamate synthase
MHLESYQETIDFLYNQLPMFSKVGAAAYKKDLTNTLELCKSFDNPHTKFKSIHIAGTNGKGSTSHMLAAVLQQTGNKVGLYTSPHLKDFRERIKINGKMIPEKNVVHFTNSSLQLIEEVQPSFFELTVVMAFDYFAQEKVDIAIIETGLGGRLDSTNVIHPLLSIITNIGYDHQNILGNTLPEIALEKAGIIKLGTPVIIGETTPETKDVFLKKATEMNAPILFAEEDISLRQIKADIGSLFFRYRLKNNQTDYSIELGLQGLYQTKNVKSVVLAFTLLNQMGFFISIDAIREGLKHVVKLTGLYGRWQLLQKEPIVIADVAHNADGIQKLLENIHDLYSKNKYLQKLHLVIGMVKDKDTESILQRLPSTAQYYFTQAHIPRALPREALQKQAASYELNGDTYENVNSALAAALQNAHARDMVVVCGSVFLIAELSRLHIQ